VQFFKDIYGGTFQSEQVNTSLVTPDCGLIHQHGRRRNLLLPVISFWFFFSVLYLCRRLRDMH
jgi:hypothetical protein